MPYKLDIPEPLPADGFRSLSPYEMAMRTRAMTCIHSKGMGECQGQVYATLFFDGTGNNQDWREPYTDGKQRDRGKHSNVARLYNAALDEQENGFFAYYLPGLGTPFPEIGDDSTSSNQLGNGAGYMGADRINWGITRLFNAVHRYVADVNLINDDAAKVLVNRISSVFRPSLTDTLIDMELAKPNRVAAYRELEAKLVTVMKGRQRKVTSINVAVFGFSRGSAEARAFAHWLGDLLKRDDSGYYTLAGVPLRFYFMGLFDTVASVGSTQLVPGFKGHMAWADGTMHIPDVVEQCVHYVALHEQRACFPLELASKVRQVAYPGMHSDVGGGYLPTEQGKVGQLSQVPLNDMHHEAFKAGVPLLSREEIEENADVRGDFYVPPEVSAACHAFWRECGIGAATGKDAVQQAIRQHTRQYLQWRGDVRTWPRLKDRGFFARANKKDQQDMMQAENDLTEQLVARRAKQGLGWDVAYTGADLHQLNGNADARELVAAMNDYDRLPNAVRGVMDDFVHDSRAGFRLPGEVLEPHGVKGGYLGYRTVFQNTRETKVATTGVATADGSTSLPDGGSTMA